MHADTADKLESAAVGLEGGIQLNFKRSTDQIPASFATFVNWKRSFFS